MTNVPSLAVAETHISWVFFVGDRAYKVKKPVRMSFLDFSTLPQRRAACEREVALNRRLAPDVYDGVATVVDPDGEVCEYIVVMRRMPDDRRLTKLLDRSSGKEDVTAIVSDIASRLAGFHATAARSTAIDAQGRVEAVAAKWSANTSELRRFAGDILDADRVETVEALARRYLAGRHQLLQERIAAGRIVDGHGDLLADDIFCLADGPRILDCLEFDDQLRWGDVLADAAFLAMDLERLGRHDVAERFLAAYRASADDDAPASLAHHYIAHRAQIRCKVACLRAAQGAATGDDARQLLDLAEHHLRRAAVRVALVGGLPGTGKTTLAARVGERLGWRVVRSDEVRKERAEASGADVSREEGGYRQGLYTPENTAATYRALVDRAAAFVARGESVVLDASWTRAGHRADAHAMAERGFADVVDLRCVAPAAVAEERIQRRLERGDDVSEATPAVARAMASDVESWPGAIDIDTAGTVDDAIKEALAALAPLDR